MDFNTAVKTCFQKYATFTGRARRAEFWWFMLFGVVLGCIALVIDSAILGRTLNEFRPVAMIITIALFLPNFAVSVRRMHDVDRSGWWIGPLWISTAVDAAFSATSQSPNDLLKTALDALQPTFEQIVLLIAILLTILGVIIFGVVMCLKRGTAGENRFGPDPIAAPEATLPARAEAL